jgi:hypothetical protein
MKRRFSEELIILILKDAEIEGNARPLSSVIIISEQAFYR